MYEKDKNNYYNVFDNISFSSKCICSDKLLYNISSTR